MQKLEIFPIFPPSFYHKVLKIHSINRNISKQKNPVVEPRNLTTRESATSCQCPTGILPTSGELQILTRELSTIPSQS